MITETTKIKSTLTKLLQYEDSMHFLSNLQLTNGSIVTIFDDNEKPLPSVDRLLSELSAINIRRDAIIAELRQIKEQL